MLKRLLLGATLLGAFAIATEADATKHTALGGALTGAAGGAIVAGPVGAVVGGVGGAIVGDRIGNRHRHVRHRRRHYRS